MPEPTTSDAAIRHMSLDMSELLSSMPDGTTLAYTHIAAKVVSAGEQQNKTPLFVSGVIHTGSTQYILTL